MNSSRLPALSPDLVAHVEFTTAVHPWRPDAGDGMFRNPVLHADYSDPDEIRQGGDFCLASSSFTATQDRPILHSRDLLGWRLINHAIQQVPPLRHTEVQPGSGVWAPSMRFHGENSGFSCRWWTRASMSPARTIRPGDSTFADFD